MLCDTMCWRVFCCSVLSEVCSVGLYCAHLLCVALRRGCAAVL